jgi:hypothetical protein
MAPLCALLLHVAHLAVMEFDGHVFVFVQHLLAGVDLGCLRKQADNGFGIGIAASSAC